MPCNTGPTRLFARRHATNFYRRFPGDYGRDTADLNLEQHGAYSLLLDIAYTTEKPLPSDRELICRMIRAGSPSEKAAVSFVIDRFFVKTRWGYTHKRVGEEITRAESRRQHAEDAATARWEQRKLPHALSIAPSIAPSNAQTMQFQTPDSRQNLKTPLPPVGTGGLTHKVSARGSTNGLQYIERYGQLVEVTMGRRKRLPNLESTAGLNADYLVEWFEHRGFVAKIVPQKDPQ